MKLSNMIPFGATLAVLAACSVDEDYSERPDGLKAIEFSSYIESNTRALDKTTFEAGDIIGLYACQTTGNYSDAFTANFMDNVAVTKDETGWTYSPLMSWPTDNNEHLSFIAFYPRNENGTALTYPFTVNPDPAQQTDPLWCTIKDANISDRNGTAINGNEADAAFEATSGSVPLKFKHLLSKVRFKVKLDGAYPGITAKLNEMTLNDIYGSGTFTMDNSLEFGTWKSLSILQDYAILTTSEEAKELSTEELLLTEMLMIPQTMTATSSPYNSSINITYTHTLAEGGEKTVNKTIYLPDSWDVNKVYNYVIKISLDVNTITVSASVDDWGAPDVEPNIGATTEAAEAVDLGLSVKWASYDYGTVSPYVSGPAFSSGTAANMSFANTWGPNWSVPTNAEWRELFSNCTVTETTSNDVAGYLVTGTNGNTIFFKEVYYGTSSRYDFASIASQTIISSSTSNSSYCFIRPVFK